MKQRMLKWQVVMLTVGLVSLMMFIGAGIFFDLAAPPSALAAARNTSAQYTVTDLGPISPRAINNKGQVAGQSAGAPALWDSGEIISLVDTFGQVSDINDAGQVVGSATRPGFTGSHAFLWQDVNGNGQSDPGELQWLSLLGDGTGSQARGINNLGQVAGTVCCTQGPEWTLDHAFLWQSGSVIDLGTLGGDSAFAYGINDHGQIVGRSPNDGHDPKHAFLWQNANMTNLAADFDQSTAFDSAAYGINNLGQVVGGGYHFNEGPFAFLWLPEAAYGLPAGLSTLDLQGSPNISINDLGQVIDNQTLWQNGVTTNLNDLFPPDSGWRVTGATTINERGQIAGTGVYNGQTRGFLLTPVTPLIFVPGIAASRLVDAVNGTERWPGLFSSQSPLSLLPEDAPFPNLMAPDVMRKVEVPVFTDEHVYDLLLENLTTSGGYVEYKVYDNPARRTTAGCDVAGQAADNPNLFIFAYDWRLDNAANAIALKDYVGCVQQFFPDTPVNILAHSMGGLLSRRYILDNPDDHEVNALITIGSPFLGAPKMIYVLESGDFVKSVTNATVKTIIASFTAAHQLLPGEPYSILAGHSPLVEVGWDLNNNGHDEEDYTYADYIDVIDDRYAHPPFSPGSTAHSFHAYTTVQGSQDDWRNDDTGVKYYHIVGQQPVDKTIGQVQAALKTTCIPSPFGLTCLTGEAFKLSFTSGDGTVPVLSAERRGNSLDYNAPGAQVHIITHTDEDLVEHTGLTHNPEVWELVYDLLADANQPRVEASAAQAATLSPPSGQVYYLKINGGESVIVEDGLGNSTAPIPDTVNGLGIVPGVDTYELGEGVHMLVIPTGQGYTVKFQTRAGGVAVELLLGSGQSVDQAVRYQDVDLPTGAAVQLTFDALAYEAMRYDSNGDGQFDAVVTPTVSVTGSQAQDVEPPVITYTTAAQANGWQVTLAAVDEGSGVKALYYSLDGMDFELYSAPFTLAPQTLLLHVLADDNVSNRATRIITLEASPAGSHRLYLPVAVR